MSARQLRDFKRREISQIKFWIFVFGSISIIAYWQKLVFCVLFCFPPLFSRPLLSQTLGLLSSPLQRRSITQSIPQTIVETRNKKLMHSITKVSFIHKSSLINVNIYHLKQKCYPLISSSFADHSRFVDELGETCLLQGE